MKKAKLTSDIILSYIESELFGIRNNINNKNDYKIGAELEIFTFKKKTEGEIDPVQLYKGEDPLIIPLIKISEKYGGITAFKYDEANTTKDVSIADKIVFPDKSSIFFEPGGQIEISTTPCLTLKDLEHQLKFHQNILKEVSELSGIYFHQSGINPISIDKLSNQFKKQRYTALESYLNNISPYGREMMLKTCSMHINMDSGISEDTKFKRIVGANLLIPYATAIFANSYVRKNDVKPIKSYRSKIWQSLDETRTGILPLSKVLQSMSIKDLIDTYYNFIIKAPLIYNVDLGQKVLSKTMTLKHWMQNEINGIYPNIAHLKNHISLLFPEVRLKGYIELRSIDSPPLDWQMLPICFYAGLLYDSLSLDKTIQLLKPNYPNYDNLYKQSCYGMESKEIRETSQELMKISIEGYSRLPQSLKSGNPIKKLESFYDQFVSQGKTFADFNP
jgi:glutamate--cysteine ligase